MSRRRRLVLVAYGPEARAFVHSGLTARLSEYGETWIAAWRPDSAAFADEPNVIAAPRVAEPALLRRVRGGCARRRGHAPFYGRVERMAAGVLGGSRAWARLYQDLGIETLLVGSGNSVRTLPALETAARLGVRTVALANSWKDAFLKPHTPLPLDAYGFGSLEEVAAFQRANPALADRAFLAGRPHLARIHAAPTREDFCFGAGLDPAQPFLCYTTASAAAAPEEPALLDVLLDRLARRGRDFRLLLRLNPMERDAERFAAVVGRPQVVVQIPAWEWFPDDEWNCPLPADSDQLAGAAAHAVANISLASTVTLEFAAWKTPVINPCWDPTGRALWNSPYYAEARAAGWATPAFTPSLAVEWLVAALDGWRPTPQTRPRADLGCAVELVVRAEGGRLIQEAAA